MDEKENKLTTTYPEKKFSSVAQLFSHSSCSITQTNEFVVAPDPKKFRKGRTYPNQWHMTASFEKSSANRILTIIRIQPDGTTVPQLMRDGNDFRVGDWEITAELDTAKQADILIRNVENGALFSFGNQNLQIEGRSYQREQGSSLLYDEMDGQWTVREMQDREPQPTGATPEM